VARGLVVLMAREIVAYKQGRRTTSRTARRGRRPGRAR
jgi:hypothetical protein